MASTRCARTVVSVRTPSLDIEYKTPEQLTKMREAGLVEVEKQGKQRLYTVARKLKKQVAANNNILDLGCCTFRFDKLPK